MVDRLFSQPDQGGLASSGQGLPQVIWLRDRDCRRESVLARAVHIDNRSDEKSQPLLGLLVILIVCVPFWVGVYYLVRQLF